MWRWSQLWEGAVLVGDSAIMGPVPVEIVVVVCRREGISLVVARRGE